MAAAAAFLPHHPSACTLPSNSGYVTGGVLNRNHRLLVEVRLQAKKSRGGRRQKSSRGGRGRRQKNEQVEEDDATNFININGVSRSVPAVPPPKSYRRSTLRIRPLQTLAPPQAPASSSRLHIDIAMFDIDDADWWEAKTLLQEAGERRRGGGGDITNSQASDNPFGTRAWPPSLVVAQLLAGLPPSDINRRPIVELGCGTGLVSLTAAGLGANAIATDISPLVLELTRRGWKETMTGLQKAGRRSNDAEVGTLSTSIFDVTSSDPLPIDRYRGPLEQATTIAGKKDQLQEQNEQQPIVIATSVLYEADLAEAMANRVAEAAAMGAWVIVGDCDSGQREGGRERFELKLEKRLKSIRAERGGDDYVQKKIHWNQAVAKCPELGWREKNVRLLHLNSPDGF